MNLQAKKGNTPSKDKLPSCSTWFRLKAERKIMVQRRRLTAVTAVSKLNRLKDTINVAPMEEHPVAAKVLG